MFNFIRTLFQAIFVRHDNRTVEEKGFDALYRNYDYRD